VSGDAASEPFGGSGTQNIHLRQSVKVMNRTFVSRYQSKMASGAVLQQELCHEADRNRGLREA
jgi:hypothetical protein